MEQQTLGNLRLLGSQVYASVVAGRKNGFLLVDGYHPMYTPRLRPTSCLDHALQQGLRRLGQLPRAAFEDACRHEVRTRGAVFAETSKHSRAVLHCRAGDDLELKALNTLCAGVAAQTRELVSEKVGLALRIQHPSALAGLERWS